MKDFNPISTYDDVLTFIDNNIGILPKEIGELRMVSDRSLLSNLTRLIKKINAGEDALNDN